MYRLNIKNYELYLKWRIFFINVNAFDDFTRVKSSLNVIKVIK